MTELEGLRFFMRKAFDYETSVSLARQYGGGIREDALKDELIEFILINEVGSVYRPSSPDLLGIKRINLGGIALPFEILKWNGRLYARNETDGKLTWLEKHVNKDKSQAWRSLDHKQFEPIEILYRILIEEEVIEKPPTTPHNRGERSGYETDK